MDKRKGIIMIGAVLFACVIFFSIFGNPLILKNGYDFGRAVKAIKAETVTLNEITPFEWETVYSFAPYASKQEMESIIGFKSNHITETVSEGMVQLIFVKGSRVVCSIRGYSSNLGYGVSLWSGGESHCQIRRGDNVAFSVIVRDNIPLLSRD